MKLNADPQIDAAYLRIREEAVADSEEVAPGVVLDFDAKGEVVGIELLGLSSKQRSLTSVEIEPKAA